MTVMQKVQNLWWDIYSCLANLSKNDLVACSVYVVLTNCARKHHRWLIKIDILFSTSPTSYGSEWLERLLFNSWTMVVCVLDHNNRWGPCQGTRAALLTSECPKKECIFIIWPCGGDSGATGGCWLCKFGGGWSRKDERNFFPMIMSYCCCIPERKDASYVKHGIAVTRPCVRYLSPLDDILDLQENDKRQLGQTMIARDEYARLIWRAEQMKKEDVFEETWTWFDLPKIKCPCFLCRQRDQSWNMLGARKGACNLTCTDGMVHVWASPQPPSFYIKSVRGDCSSISIICHSSDQPERNAMQAPLIQVVEALSLGWNAYFVATEI